MKIAGIHRVTASVALASVMLGMTLPPALTQSVAQAAAPSSDNDAEASSASWTARVSGTLGRGLVVRQGPGQTFRSVGSFAEGARVEVIDGPTADSTGHDWYQIRNDRTGVTGWSAGDFLVEIDADETEQAAPVASNGRTMTVKTTGYYYGPGARTRMGTPVHWGEVAVDPSVIPLGSRIKIDGFDTIFTAEDTGGGVRGAWIDIFFPSYAEAIQWGVQYRTVTILN